MKTRLTPIQKALKKQLQANPRNRIIPFGDHQKKVVRYEVTCWEGDKPTVTYPNPRTVDSLFSKGVLVHTNGAGIFVFSSGTNK